MQPIYDWFREFYERTGINLTFIYDDFDRARMVKGFFLTIELSVITILLSILIGIAGAWLQGSKLVWVRRIIAGFISAFRNTPPLVQIYFFYFGLGYLLPRVPDGSGALIPMISNFQWAVISLSLFAGAFNIEIFRSGIEAIPKATVEGATSLGLSRWQTYRLVVLPIAIRVCLPALGNNLVNLLKTTNLAYAIAVPELLYVSKQIWSDATNVREMMIFVLVAYLALVFVLVGILHAIERRLVIPGFGQEGAKPVAGGDMAVPAPATPALEEKGGRPAIARTILLFLLIVGAGATIALAQQPAAVKSSASEILVRWAPLLLWGFAFNILISLMAMAVGTLAGVPVGIAQISRFAAVRVLARIVTQLFRNSPWLVLLFLCMFLIPFEIRIFDLRIPFPDWAKAILGFSLPVMANTSEIVRGAIRSIATGQWDGARALGLTRWQTLGLVILPQSVKRMLPPWMNLYSLITMATVNASIVGVSEMITLMGQVHAAEGSRPELLAPLYAFALVCFFLYCYPIGKWTQALERRYQRAS
ncbi:MAG TPA: amino acid ABC transporter permease [Hyphomicrobiaceae bacterium]